MGTDFFDEDLVREREAALKIKLNGEAGNAPRDGIIPSSRDLPNRPVSDLTLTHLSRHKQEVTDQMVDKAQELDRLRARQEELERERRTLEEMRKKQEAFDVGRRELKERLNESLVRMEKERLQSERLCQLLEETRRLFRERLDEVETLNESEWADENLLDELNRALVLLENVRSDYNKSMAKIEAIHPQVPGVVAERASPLTFEDASISSSRPAQGFYYWLRAGFAFTLPLIVAMAVLTLFWMWYSYFWA